MAQSTQQKMQQTTMTRPEIQLVGLSVRTGYEQEFNKIDGKIFPCVQKYFQQTLFEQIPNRKKPGTTFCAYTQYESNYKGSYTYFIGEEVTSLDEEQPEGFDKLIIPAQTYAKFTTNPAPMPAVLLDS